MARYLDAFLRASASEVNRELLKFLPRRITKKWVDSVLGVPEFGFDYAASEGAVTGPIWDFLDRGGKRWRPALMLLSCEAVGGKPALVKGFCVVPELIHTGTLIVDDVEDGSLLRRGKKALHVTYGVDIAVNAGNLLYFLPLKVLDAFVKRKGRAFRETAASIYGFYIDEMMKLSFGQAMDIYWHHGHNNVSEKQYLQMCSYKTGSLARFSAGLGAALGGASEKQARALIDFAGSVGVAFQIHDDVLNLRPGKFWGKEIGDDIKEGKRTLIVIHSLSKLGPKKRKRLLQILGSQSSSRKDVAEAIGILESTGSIDYASGVARRLVSKSWGNLGKQLRESRAKETLKGFADYLVERKI